MAALQLLANGSIFCEREKKRWREIISTSSVKTLPNTGAHAILKICRLFWRKVKKNWLVPLPEMQGSFKKNNISKSPLDHVSTGPEEPFLESMRSVGVTLAKTTSNIITCNYNYNNNSVN